MQTSLDQLRNKINTQQILTSNNSSLLLHYTMCKKEATTVSIIHHQRLLILNQGNDTIYYTNDVNNTPFKTQDKIPKQKNHRLNINNCVIKRYQQQGKPTNILLMQFTVKQDGKDKKNTWKFQMQNTDLPLKWQNLVKQIKQKRIKQEQKRKYQEQQRKRKQLQKQKQKQRQRQRQKKKKQQQQRKKIQQQRKKRQQQLQRSRQEQSYRKNQLQLQKQRQLELQESRQKQLQRTKRQQQQKTDWNLKFIQNRSKQTITQFSIYCLSQFRSFKVEKIRQRLKEQNTVIIKQNRIIMYFTHPNSEVSRLLTQQFRNYEYILRACGSNSCIGVPLTCLISEKGVLCMAKARFPENVKIIYKNQLKQNNPFATTVIGLFKQLESHTKINSQIVINSCKILNLSIHYDFNNGFPRIFIDQLQHLLPHYPDIGSNPSLTQNSLKQLVHPLLIKDNFNRVINPAVNGIVRPQQDKTQQQLYFYVQQSLNQLAKLLIQQDIIVCSYGDLQQVMNFYGLNITMIHSLHHLIQLRAKNQQARYLKAFLMSLKCGMLIFQQKISPLLCQSNQPQKQILGILKMYCEGNSALNQHAWKDINNIYKKKYGNQIFYNDILGGIVLSSLIQQIGGSYYIQILQKNKQLLKQKQIIHQDFIKTIEKTKVKSYNCQFNKQQQNQQDKIMSLCQNIKVDNMKIIKQLRMFKNVQDIDRILSKTNKMKYITYVSRYISPFQSQFPQLQEYIYNFVNQQPPNIYIYHITLNYIRYYKEQILKVRLLENEQKSKIMSQKYLQFVHNVITTLQFWFGKQNPFLCQIIQQHAELEFVYTNHINKYIHSIRTSLSLWERTCGISNYSVGNKNKKIGMVLYKNGFNKQALQYLYKFKHILQENIDKNLQQYAALLSQIAELQLSDSRLPQSRISAELSNDKLQKIRQYQKLKRQGYTMKNEQMISILYNNCRILFRIFQIQKNINKLKQLAIDMNRVLYYQKNPNIFTNVLKMCITSAIYSIGVQNKGYSKLLTIRQYMTTAYKASRKQKYKQQQNKECKHRANVKKIASEHIISQILKHNLQKVQTPSLNKQQQSIRFKYLQSIVQCGGGPMQVQPIIIQVLDYVSSINNL